MANTQKRDYVSTMFSKLQSNPHFVLVGFEKTSHTRLEEFRGKLRSMSQQATSPELVVLKNSLFKVALERYVKAENNVISEEEVKMIQDLVSGQTMLLLLSGDWMEGVKAISAFAKEEEGIVFRAGLIEGVAYQEMGLKQLSSLPSKEELVVKVILALRSSQTKIAYSLKFNMMKLVNVIKNASEKTN